MGFPFKRSDPAREETLGLAFEVGDAVLQVILCLLTRIAVSIQKILVAPGISKPCIHSLLWHISELRPKSLGKNACHDIRATRIEAGHAEIAQAIGKPEASGRQQLRRALLRLRQSRARQACELQTELEPPEEAIFRLYLQALLMQPWKPRQCRKA
jgi:hypothetical protein